MLDLLVYMIVKLKLNYSLFFSIEISLRTFYSILVSAQIVTALGNDLDLFVRMRASIMAGKYNNKK